MSKGSYERTEVMDSSHKHCTQDDPNEGGQPTPNSGNYRTHYESSTGYRRKVMSPKNRPFSRNIFKSVVKLTGWRNSSLAKDSKDKAVVTIVLTKMECLRIIYRNQISRDDTMIRNIFLGFVRINILYHASKEEIFGVEIMKELRRHGYSISPGTLYPILHSLENQEYLSSRKKVVEGKIRKYYQITGKGMSILGESKERTRELVREVLKEG